MRRTVHSILSLLTAGCLLLIGAGAASAQSQDGDPVIVVIDGVEYVVDDTTVLPPGLGQFDPFGSLPSDIVILEPGQPLPGFFGEVPPEYAFFVDPTLPVPDEFAFLVDPRLPIPPEYAFMFDARLPVPEEWEWLFPSAPGQAPVVEQVEPTPVPEATSAPVDEATDDTEDADDTDSAEPESTPQVVVDLSPLADEQSVTAETDADESQAEPDDVEVDATTVAAEVDEEETPTAAPVQASRSQPAADRSASSNLLVPLLIFVAVASTALLAAVPVFLRHRKGTDTALRELVLTDDLTRLANRRRLDRDLRMHNRGKDVIAVAMIDIDHFKRLNDDFSHAVGDLVLQHVAATISQNVRSNDVAYRYGGEEFCVLLPGASENEAAAVVDRVRRAVESLSFEVLDRRVTVSAGVASAKPDHTQGDHAMVQRADAALYAAKNSGRNRVMLSSLVERAKPQ